MKAYARYSGMAIQMGIIILLGAYGGQWLDKRTGAEKPWFTLLGSLLGIAAALYIVLKGLFKQQ